MLNFELWAYFLLRNEFQVPVTLIIDFQFQSALDLLLVTFIHTQMLPFNLRLAFAVLNMHHRRLPFVPGCKLGRIRAKKLGFDASLGLIVVI